MQFPEWGSGLGKHIIRMKDGDSIQGVFRGEIVRFYQHWANNKPSVCPGRDICDLCAKGEKFTGRFRVNFLTQEEGKWIAKVFEQGRRVFDQMVALNKDCPIEKMRVRITRTGQGQQSQFHVNGLPGEQGIIKADLEKQLLQVPLHDLSMDVKKEEEEEFEPGMAG